MARREFLQLAKPFQKDHAKTKIAGWLVSEKLDGTRCFWDGGVSRGVPTQDVPWAGLINPKNGLRKDKIKPLATGLWSRYGNPIMAPAEFLDELPPTFLDGELWAGRGNFQLCRSICGGDTPDPRFMDEIQYAVYGCPSVQGVFGDGEIKNSNFHRAIKQMSCMEFLQSRAGEVDLRPIEPKKTFEEELRFLSTWLDHGQGGLCYVHRQQPLAEDEDDARDQVGKYLDAILAVGAEGAVIRNPRGVWTPKRVNDLLKFKPWEDDEGTVVGFTSGRETDKGSKHLGKIGALILDYNGKRLELSGLTDAEREFADESDAAYAREHPGQDMPQGTQGTWFKVGQMVTFKYRELSDDGIPKEARYWRKRDVE